MAIRTPWVCSFLLLALALHQGCSPKPAPLTLGSALRTAGGPKEKAKRLLAVAAQERGELQREAFFLAALYAADARSPAAALHAFARAKPEGGRAFLALRRLEEACAEEPLPPQVLQRFLSEPWLGPGAAGKMALASAEAALAKGEVGTAQRLVTLAEDLGAAGNPRLRLLRAACWPEEALFQQRQLLLEAPRLLERVFTQIEIETLTRSFSAEQWRQLGAAWLAAGEPRRALVAARKAKNEGAEVAAAAYLSLRQSRRAAAWAARLPHHVPQRFLLLAQALRQQAWGSSGLDRSQLFAQVESAARRAANLAQGPVRAQALVLWAEALGEQQKFEGVAQILREAAPAKPPRWEWVVRRVLFNAAAKGQVLDLPLEAAGPRLGRIYRFWRGFLAWRGGDSRELQELAQSGHPDLVSLWAARLLGQKLQWEAKDVSFDVPPPPSWSTWLVTAGRISDVVVAWRAELEASGTQGPEWLGLLQLAKLPPLEAIPFLVRGEPRLLSGPWDGLPKSLLRHYLPLPFIQEIEGAARAFGVPPWVLAAVVRQESAFNPQARSPKGALGLAQLLPETVGLPAAKLLQPKDNLQAGARLLSQLLARFQGAWEPTLAAYNAGEARIRPAWEAAGRKEGPFFVEALELPETWDYLHRVMLFAQGYKALYWPEGDSSQGEFGGTAEAGYW